MIPAIKPLYLIAGGIFLVLFLELGHAHSYTTLILWTFLLQGILALSYNLLGGYGGELHLGHGTFFGIGAYVSILMMLTHIPWWISIILAGMSGFLIALMISPLLIPLKGAPFSLASLVLLLLFQVLFRNISWLTGGVNGLSLDWITSPTAWLPSTIVLFILCFYIHDTLVDSKFTRELRAISDDPQAAAVCGLSCNKIRTKALLLGSTMASLAGGILPIQSLYISLQSTFGLEVALTPVVAVLIGGPGTRLGPLLGTLLYLGIQEWIWTAIGAWHLALLGLVLILSGLFFPSGLAGLLPFNKK
jgi:branched-chain amino acid transport system permease protein